MNVLLNVNFLLQALTELNVAYTGARRPSSDSGIEEIRNESKKKRDGSGAIGVT